MSATIDITGDVEFNLVQGDTGSKRMVFQLITNQTDFLTYNYLVYGIKEAEYKKVTIKSWMDIGSFMKKLSPPSM